MSIAIVGDLHIAPIPRNRIDDYFTAALDKIEQIAQKNKYVIFLGDIFSKPKIDDSYVNGVILHLYYLKMTYGTSFYTIIGNHDVQSELEEKLYQSSLGTLIASKVMDVITPDNPLEINDTQIYRFNTIPVNYKRAKEYIKGKNFKCENCINILLVHHEYETGTNKITYDDIKDLGCEMIFFGHDHCPLPEGRIIYQNLTIYRSGSLMRNIAQDYNFTRQIYYYQINNGCVKCEPIIHRPANEVFTVESFTREQYHKKQLIANIDTLIEKYKNNITTQDKFSMESILKGLNAPDSVITYIKKKYESRGERFV